MLSNSPVTDCNVCGLGIASQGRCRLTPTSRESGSTICAQGAHRPDHPVTNSEDPLHRPAIMPPSRRTPSFPSGIRPAAS